jgi:hypothetical protein
MLSLVPAKKHDIFMHKVWDAVLVIRDKYRIDTHYPSDRHILLDCLVGHSGTVMRRSVVVLCPVAESHLITMLDKA